MSYCFIYLVIAVKQSAMHTLNMIINVMLNIKEELSASL